MEHLKRIWVFPGMGATSDMYGGAWRSVSGARFLDWPVLRDTNRVTLASIAEGIIVEHQMVAEDVLVGSSLGGIVAQEIARQLRSEQVILVGSAATRSEIQPILLQLARFVDLTPLSLIQLLAGKSPMIVSSMFAEADARFVRETSKLLIDWQGSVLPETRVDRIHGAADHVIRCPRDGVCCVDGGGHLIAMTHADACVRFVKEKTMR